MHPKMRAMCMAAALLFLLVPAAKAEDDYPVVDLRVEFDSLTSGNIRFNLQWAVWGNLSEDYGTNWSELETHFTSDPIQFSNDTAIHAIVDYLRLYTTIPGTEDSYSGSTDEAVGAALLAQQDGVVTNATISTLRLYHGGLHMRLDFELAPLDSLELRPLAFVSDLPNATGIQTELTIWIPPDLQITSNRFVLNHIQIPTGTTFGLEGKNLNMILTDAVLYDPVTGEITIQQAEKQWDALVMAGIMIVYFLMLILLSRRYHTKIFIPLGFWLIAMIFYVFTSLPWSGYLFYGVIIFGLLRQFAKGAEAAEVKKDMDGLREALISKSWQQEDTGPELEELGASRNPLARLFPFKIQELFLIYDDGRLMAHGTLHDSSTVDSDILSSMLTAIGDFIKDSFQADDDSGLENLKYGKINLYIQRCNPLYLAGVISGNPPEDFGVRMKEFVSEISEEFSHLIKNWKGDTGEMDPIQHKLQDFIKYWSKTL